MPAEIARSATSRNSSQTLKSMPSAEDTQTARAKAMRYFCVCIIQSEFRPACPAWQVRQVPPVAWSFEPVSSECRFRVERASGAQPGLKLLDGLGMGAGPKRWPALSLRLSTK